MKLLGKLGFRPCRTSPPTPSWLLALTRKGERHENRVWVQRSASLGGAGPRSHGRGRCAEKNGGRPCSRGAPRSRERRSRARCCWAWKAVQLFIMCCFLVAFIGAGFGYDAAGVLSFQVSFGKLSDALAGISYICIWTFCGRPNKCIRVQGPMKRGQPIESEVV